EASTLASSPMAVPKPGFACSDAFVSSSAPLAGSTVSACSRSTIRRINYGRTVRAPCPGSARWRSSSCSREDQSLGSCMS
ncbi:hypothetical protein LTR48_009267, partial [Friedmanniomyces endolithicus]